MKRITSLIAGILLAGSISAQGVYQFKDPGFDGTWKNDNEPGNGWTSFASADASSLGGLVGSIAQSQSPKPSKVEGYLSTTAVKIFSKSIVGANANGNLTTGQIHMGSSTPTDASNYNSTRIGNSEHSLLFEGMPDAVGFFAKFKSGGSPNGRGNFILHDECEYRDPELSSQQGNRVGKATALITPCSDWTYFEGEFEYDRTKKPSSMYLLATFTTNPTPGGSSNDELIIDDVYFIYYSTLKSLSYKGADINFKEGTLSYDLSSHKYAATSLTYQAKGIGATVETEYNSSTALLKITVKGNDYPVNRDSKTIYTVQFAAETTPPTPDPDPNPEPEPGEVDYTPSFTGEKQKSDRAFERITLVSNEYSGATENTLTVGNNPALNYCDYTESVTMVAAPGETVTLDVQIAGSWMNAYAYIDFDGDGFTASIEEGSNHAPAEDLVSYSFYNNGSNDDSRGWDSTGRTIIGDGRSTVELPQFTVPAEPGLYRVRVKLDWCNIDPMGDRDGKFGDFLDNGGHIIDFMLQVKSNVDYTPSFTGEKEKSDRLIEQITLISNGHGNTEENTLTVDNSPALNYCDYTESVTMVAAPSETVTLDVQIAGSWMNAYAYIDFDGDGFTASIEEGSNYAPAGDLVAYSFYNNGSNDDNSGWDSAGRTVKGDSRSTVALPQFTVPAEPGLYRVRVKLDWCNIDPMGDRDGKFGDFLDNGGHIIDFMLQIATPTAIEEVECEEEPQETIIYDLSGRRIMEITKPGIYIINGKKVVVK
ncbi:MAG: hypothetical protein IKZ37_06785 [Bacteroidaceae bacterium]|nr:hypothetical protein [Bacteroidaceae bacterium]